ncbi:MAG: hypothetical protein KJ958_05575 [Gammaproteobacteria bacterium]|nr:hypothetical protein [Gammaproteobacteria bacterium]MBU1978624.1 hypothetical protein [Gammaproteobacteria bacterium]
MENQQEITIRNEAQAFHLIEKALKQEIGDIPIQIKFDGWPILEIELEGEGYEGTITAEMAGALVELQHAMNRAFARSVHHSTNARKLTNEERQDILFKAKVDKGCSLITIDLGKFGEKLVTNLVDKMTPEHLVMTVVGLAVVAGGTLAYKAFLKHSSEDKKTSEETHKAIAMSQEETKRMAIFSQAMNTHPALDHARQDFDIARNEMLKGTADAKTISVNGVEIDREAARVISMHKRTESKAVQLNGNYFIRKVDWHIDGEVRLSVANVDNARVFQAAFTDDSLDKEQTKILQKAEWARSKVYLSINGTELRGEITTATVIGVTEQPQNKVAGE